MFVVPLVDGEHTNFIHRCQDGVYYFLVLGFRLMRMSSAGKGTFLHQGTRLDNRQYQDKYDPPYCQRSQYLPNGRNQLYRPSVDKRWP